MLGQRIVINVSGEVFETFVETIDRYPNTLLGCKQQRYKYSDGRQLFFDRNRLSFASILYFYQSHGKLNCPHNVKITDFIDECAFFRIPETFIHNLRVRHHLTITTIPAASDDTRLDPQSLRAKLWKFVDRPSSSIAAKVYSIFSLAMIGMSVLTSCLETLPMLIDRENVNWKNTWFRMEFAINVWFLVELTFRFCLTPGKREFCRSKLNWLDAFAVIPYFIALSIDVNAVKKIGLLNLFKCVRIVRICRMSKQSRRLQVVSLIIMDSLSDFQLFLVCLLIMVIFGGSVLYNVEKAVPGSSFTSVPESMWCALQTLVTLGYGDITPETDFGKAFLCLFMLFGALTLSLPVLSVVIKFTSSYTTD